MQSGSFQVENRERGGFHKQNLFDYEIQMGELMMISLEVENMLKRIS